MHHLINATKTIPKILEKVLSVDLLPHKKYTNLNADGNKQCLYHYNLGHTTKESSTLIEELKSSSELAT